MGSRAKCMGNGIEDTETVFRIVQNGQDHRPRLTDICTTARC